MQKLLSLPVLDDTSSDINYIKADKVAISVKINQMNTKIIAKWRGGVVRTVKRGNKGQAL